MSTSTLSISANPTSTSARRRPVVVGEKKKNSGVDFLTTDAAATVPLSNGTSDDKVSAGKDLSNSIRADTFLERSRDMVQIKKAAGPSTLSPRRTRKVVPKPEKSRWRTLLSVFTKNFVLLLVVLGLVQMIRRLALNSSSSSSSGTPLVALDLENRIAEVDSFLKKTAKMMQVQVEVVDRKIENVVEGLRKEFTKKIEEKTLELGSEVKRLDARSRGLEMVVSELKSMDFLTKDDLETLYDELKAAKGSSEEVGSQMSLDDVRAVAKQVIEKEIERHAADGLGMIDYALASAGAMVVKHSKPFVNRKGWFYMNIQNGVHSEAVKMLRPSFGEPGECFPLKGSSGFVQIRLRTAIIPEAVTLEHVAQSVAYDRSSAPKDCRVSGWLQGHDTELTVGTENWFRLADFTYDLERSNAQTFKLVDLAGTGLVDMIRLDFASNHGSPAHTCIYRLRVHGHEPNSVSVMARQS